MPWQTLSATWAQNTHTTTDAPCSQPAARLLHPLHLGGQQPLDFRLTKAGTLQALLQQEGRRSGVRSPTAFYCALQSQTAKFRLTVERTRGHITPHRSLSPRTTDANYTVASHLVYCITYVTFDPGSAPPFRGRICPWHNSTWTAEFWCSVATRFFRNTKDQRKLLAFGAKDREVCSALS